MSRSPLPLSPFQKEKLEYYFNFFDTDGNGKLELKDLDGFMKKVLEFTGWSEDSVEARECHEVHECFFSTMIEKAVKKGKDKISVDKWYSLWEHMIPGSTAMVNFPIWLRLLPRSLFRIIDSKHNGKIDKNELSDFYIKFVGISPENVDSLSQYAMDQMTDNGKYPLNMDLYNQIFANFLIGRTPFGPGRFVFGCFEHMVGRTQFKLIQGPPENIQDPLLDFKKLNIVHGSPSTPSSLVKVKYFQAG